MTKQPESSSPIYFEDRLPYTFPIVAFALSDLYSFLNEVEHLFSLSFELAPISLIYKHFDPRFNGFLHPLIKIQSQSERNIDFIPVTPENLLTFSAQAATPSPDQANFSFVSNFGVETIREYLNYITHSVFRYANGTKPHQERVLQNIFDGQDVLGIFPTGSGKSFCFWLPALLKPGLSIVICPLRSLMRDQRLTLENYGIASADFINSDVKKDERLRIINDAKLGKLKLLYVAPERIRIKDFVDELRSIQHFVNINYLIIDEAHCISEWGHDFRPSYLNIPYFYDQLKQQNEAVQLIALTATAGQMVRRDVVNLLSLKEQYVLTERDLDRIHFSYQIESVDGYDEKANK
ncbi:MAG TPA: DEAD/DEAH box helicase, partial [Candidatus Hodarchaeales archaeon]|nr:DEAD/DEAH box helicase [Candidatus Hodarchaeales archaeon]